MKANKEFMNGKSLGEYENFIDKSNCGNKNVNNIPRSFIFYSN